MNFYFVLFCLTIVGPAFSINVTVYYESLCPDSVEFITRQLYPSYSSLEEYIKIKLVPFGKAFLLIENDNYMVSCQHGPAECSGNKYQACLLDQNKGQKTDVAVINCIMSQPNPSIYRTVENCASLFKYNTTVLRKCANGPRGDQLIIMHGNKTMDLDPNLSFVPTIIYNDFYNQTEQEASLKDFAAVVCHKIKSGKPKICNGKSFPRATWYDWLNY